jgi:stearoyl-CoA desaturase (delta-9 desaturase)
MSKLPFFPLAHSLKTFRSNEIEKGRLQQQQKALDRKRQRLDWGIPLTELPVITWDDFQARSTENGKALVAIGGVIHDVSAFVAEHPGGKTLIKSAVGKDATALFNGGVYEHSNAAHNLLATMRVGVLRGGQEVEVWKMQRAERKTSIMHQVTRVEGPAVTAVAA